MIAASTRAWALLTLATLSACRTQLLPEQDPGGDAAIADLAVDASGWRDASVDGAPDLGLCPTPELPSRQTVTFKVHNRASADRYVMTRGEFCDPFSIDGISLAVGFQCLCECAPPEYGPLAFRRVAAGATWSFSWDARRLETCTTQIDCAMWGWGDRMVPELRGSLQPAATGGYHMTVGVETALPASCMLSGDDAYCGQPGGGWNRAPPSPQIRCDASATAAADFTLPASGDVTVDVDVR